MGASAARKSAGCGGWNSISKRLALYDMTGDAFHAGEALRLAFPYEQANREIVDEHGSPTCIGAAAQYVVFATDRGEIRAFDLG